MFRQVYIDDWFRDGRYGTYIFVYVAGNAGSWGGIDKRFKLIIRIRRDGGLSSLSIVSSSVTKSEIRGWYGPAENIGQLDAARLAGFADNHLTNFFPETVYRSTSNSLIAFAYG